MITHHITSRFDTEGNGAISFGKRYTMITKKNVWVRVAGNAKNVKAGLPHGWRCFFIKNPREKEASGETSLTNFSFIGVATNENVIPGTHPRGGEAQSVLAWIDLYGDIAIDDKDVLRIILKDP